MAAVTVTQQRSNVNGALREKYYILTIANSNTLITGFHIVRDISCNDTGVTLITASGGTLTFSGSSTGALVKVTGL